jgi:hypothetical protein
MASRELRRSSRQKGQRVMSETKHTPGPWSTLIPNGRTVTSAEYIICDMSNISMEEEQANARLIAAAPTMLEALKAIAEKNPADVEIFDLAVKAIALAVEGQ